MYCCRCGHSRWHADDEDVELQGKQQSKDASSVGEDPTANNLAGSIWVLQGEGLHTQAPTYHHQHPQVWTAPNASTHSPMTGNACIACCRLPFMVRTAI